ncbi:MAG: chitobiase/beta-hexosaminidase C-terminal domain-containing protein, partial [Saprospiraceae bacterium]
MRLKYFSLLLIISSALATTKAQVVINEYSAANLRQFTDDHNDYEDWIELYNNGINTADISGYWISDDSAEIKKFQFPLGTSIKPDSFLIVWCSGRNLSVNHSFHTGFRLTQTKGTPDILVLSNSQGAILQMLALEKTALHQSRCRSVDGGNTWKICTAPTPGASNNLSSQYKSLCTRPGMNPPAGFYSDSVEVTITQNGVNQEIHYTMDGTEPTALSPVYTGPLTLTQTTIVKARNISSNPEVLPGLMRFNTYFINESFSLQVFSIAGDSLQDLANGTREIRPVGSI